MPMVALLAGTVDGCVHVQFYAKCPRPAWWPLEEWNAAQMKRGRNVLEIIWAALQELQLATGFAH